MRISLLILPFFIFTISSCVTEQKVSKSGVVISKLQFFDTTIPLRPVFNSGNKIWYKDSLVIEEIKLTKINTDTSGRRTIEDIVEHYTFIDLSSKSFYEYKNFSDTARCFKKYFQPDSMDVDGGWNFYANRELSYKGTHENLSDTVISGTTYKRIKFYRNIRGAHFFTVAYFRCDKKGSMFQFYKSSSEQIGCPMVKVYNFPEKKDGRPSSTEVDFVSDKLTSEEQKIFEAWERNAKQNPVDK